MRRPAEIGELGIRHRIQQRLGYLAVAAGEVRQVRPLPATQGIARQQAGTGQRWSASVTM
jgi:hypothetical protein